MRPRPAGARFGAKTQYLSNTCSAPRLARIPTAPITQPTTKTATAAQPAGGQLFGFPPRSICPDIEGRLELGAMATVTTISALTQPIHTLTLGK
jgi:hypothetical protein